MSIVRATGNDSYEPLTGMYKDEIIQDILRILGLSVDTFSESINYNVDDFVVKNQLLWRCIEATTGIWNEEKWVKDSIIVPSE